MQTNLCISTAILITLALGATVQRQLYSFLKTRNKRLVNKIILSNVLVQNINYPIILCYILLAIWIQNLSYYISDYGCYGFSIILKFSGLFDRSVSFFINLSRYICIVHDETLKKHNVHPKVSLLYGSYNKMPKIHQIKEHTFSFHLRLHYGLWQLVEFQAAYTKLVQKIWISFGNRRQ